MNTILDLGYATQDIRYTKEDDRTFTISITDQITGVAKDLTGYTFSSGIIYPAVSFTVSNLVPLTGVITISITATSISALTTDGQYTWYLKYVKDTKTRTYLEGKFILV